MHIVRNNSLEEVGDDEDYDYELTSPARQVGTHINAIPLQSNVQSTRAFYGSRFLNQALALENGEAPFVQNLNPEDPDGRSFDEILGEQMGAVKAKAAGKIMKVDPDFVRVKYEDGKTEDIGMYNNFAYNQKSGNTSRALLKPGDTFKARQQLTATSFTDDAGVMNMGMNARIGLVPWKGFSMDDAIPISASFANRLKATQFKVFKQDKSDNLNTDLNHFRSLFPTKFAKEKLETMGEHGIVKPGTILQKGDPIILATMPRTVTSAGASVGKLSKALRQSRRDASQTWEGDQPAEVVAARMTKAGLKVVLKYSKPTKEGDKLVLRQGAKATTSRIIPDDQMPRGADGEPLDMLLNPLSLTSRANPASQYEIRLGKIAKKLGKALKVPSYLPKGTDWNDYVDDLEREHGVESQEQVFDPVANRFLASPITVGYGFVNRLHHTAEGKVSSRGTGSYDCFDKDTEVLTDRGWVFWPEVTENDKLCTPDEGMDSAVFELPKRLVSYDFDGSMLRYESPHLDWLVTPNHKFLTYAKKGKLGYETAENFRDRVRSVPQFGFHVKTTNSDFKIIPPTNSGRSLRNREPLRLSFEDYAEFMGWWISEGSIRVDEGRVYIWQHKHINPKNFTEIESLLTRMFAVKPWNHEDKGWRISDRRLSEFLIQYGKDSGSKCLPDDIITAGEKSSKLFLSAYIKGDGFEGNYKKFDGRKSLNNVKGVGSTSKQLVDDLQIFLLRRGMGMAVRRRHSEGKIITFKGAAKSYIGSAFYASAIRQKRRRATVVPRRGLKRYVGAWSEEYYAGKVYCATTRTGLLVTRRNGKVVVTGNSNEQPARGSGENANAKRFSGLENFAALSSGAYPYMKENSTLKGQKNDAYWRAMRSGAPLPKQGSPFVWDKFRALLSGAGMNTKEIGKGRFRLTPFTDADLDAHDPVEVENGELVNMKDMSSIKGGLFDDRIVARDRWGSIKLPRPVINPAMEDSVRTLLGLTKKNLEAVLAGQVDLKDVMKD